MMRNSTSHKKESLALSQVKAMMILIAGPYRSGTNDDPVLIQKNVNEMESYALPIFRAGHIPILGEWLALPLLKARGSKKIGDDAFTEMFHPMRSGFSKNATQCLESVDHLRERMRWSASAVNLA